MGSEERLKAETLAFLIVTVFAGLQAGAQESLPQGPVPLTAGMVIDRSITVRPGIYRLEASADLAAPAIVVRGEHITIDFNGAVLAGSADGADPDTFAGVGLLVDGRLDGHDRERRDFSLGGYPKNRDTKSHGYLIQANTFRGNKVALDVRGTADVRAERDL